MLCDSMRRQIISRAFYGWLAHCRHIASVRTYLIALVNKEITSPHFPTDASVGVTEKVWKTLFQNGKVGIVGKIIDDLITLSLFFCPERNMGQVSEFGRNLSVILEFTSVFVIASMILNLECKVMLPFFWSFLPNCLIYF